MSTERDIVEISRRIGELRVQWKTYEDLHDTVKADQMKHRLMLLCDDLLAKAAQFHPPPPARDERPLLKRQHPKTMRKIYLLLNETLTGHLNVSESMKGPNWLGQLFGSLDQDMVSSNPLVKGQWAGLPKITDIKCLKIPNSGELIDLSKQTVHAGYENIFYNDGQSWEIDAAFFHALASRFQVSLADIADDDVSRILCAARMYVIHEALHRQVHGLGSDNVNEIGRLPRVLEEADYQADVYAMLTELSFKTRERGRNLKRFREAILQIMDTALETTFSFAPAPPISRMQVRNVQRIIIWLMQRVRIEEIVAKDDDDQFNGICAVLAEKPVIDLRGPAHILHESRLYYDLRADSGLAYELGMFYENQIMRAAARESLNVRQIFEGIRDLNIDLVKKALRGFYIERLQFAARIGP